MEHSYHHICALSVLVPLLLIGMALTVWTPPGVHQGGREREEERGKAEGGEGGKMRDGEEKGRKGERREGGRRREEEEEAKGGVRGREGKRKSRDTYK